MELKLHLEATPADIRDEAKRRKMLQNSSQYQQVMESIEQCCENGASIICIETTGGKSVSDYGISRGDREQYYLELEF